MLRNILQFIIVCNLFVMCETEQFQLKEGDLLFQKRTESSFAQAINKVTEGYDDHDFAHVGMVINEKGSLKVFEATQKNGVALTELDKFLSASTTNEGHPNIAVGRIKTKYEEHIPVINDWVLSQLDKTYDTLFIYGNEKYYCSELIHDAFNQFAGDKIFDLAPMTFVDPDTQEYFPIWEDYFQKNDYPIPEGEPGINPGMMSRSSKIEIVHEYF